MTERLTVRMPALSATMEEGELVSWRVAVGDTVSSGQPIAEVVTDKVDMELESPYDGVVAELVVQPGTSVPVGGPVAVLTSESDDLLGGLGLDDEDSAEAAQEPSSIPPAPPPLRKRAKELGVDLSAVEATGKRGQITRDDLDRHLASRAERVPDETQASAPAHIPRPRREVIRSATARLMIQSAQIPQFVLHRRVDLSRAQERKQGRSWTTEIARALNAALRDAPELCARWEEEASQVVPIPEPRLGLAVESEDGLVVIGLDALDRLTPDEADHHVRDSIRRAREGHLRPADREGLTCTLSNLGSHGIDSFAALVMPPQAAILSVGRVADVPVVVDGRVRALRCADLGLTVDHRVADGAQGARLLAAVAERLEE